MSRLVGHCQDSENTMETYKPESNFQAICDASLVYNLRSTGCFRKGQEEWENDVAIAITARYLSDEQRADIARTIRDAMNSKYLPNDPMEARDK